MSSHVKVYRSSGECRIPTEGAQPFLLAFVDPLLVASHLVVRAKTLLTYITGMLKEIFFYVQHFNNRY